MAKSRFEYVKQFERENYLLPDSWIVIRVDGRGFHRFSSHYDFRKPNDERALRVMNQAAGAVMRSIPDVMMAYGDSDEYSFVLRKNCTLFERRESKLVSTFASTFTAYYMQLWPAEFPDQPLEMAHLPTFDSRAVVYPSVRSLRDYFSWRQADCHINNLYNTTFWTLVQQGGRTTQQAEEELCKTVSSDKHEILFSKFGINYNNEPEMYKKGTTLVREYLDVDPETVATLSSRQLERLRKKNKVEVRELYVDIIGDAFWNERPWLLM
ncbi:tRNA(His) guanylyltransferase [Trichomonascus vanleenenianus]|uniref:tRNA guanylyltransferase n=1 Tax=Trichomonascus vanleenenianus TaxID=2268995 RepID=UPI003EC9743A